MPLSASRPEPRGILRQTRSLQWNQAAEKCACQQPLVARAELPLTPPEPLEPPAIPDDPAAMELLAVPVLLAPPVCEAELPETPLPDEPSAAEEPLPLVPPEILAVEPVRSTQFGLAAELPVLDPPCANAIEPEPKMRAATLNNLIDLFMCFSLPNTPFRGMPADSC